MTLTKSLIPVLTVSALISGAALAQNVHPQNATSYYGEARGWEVYSLDTGQGIGGCRAFAPQTSSNVEFFMDYFGGQWMLAVPTGRFDASGYGSVFVDDGAFSVDFWFENGLAVHFMDNTLADWIRQGSSLQVSVDQDYTTSVVLNGSAAAMLKAEECWDFAGNPPIVAPQPPIVQTPQRPIRPATPVRPAPTQPQVAYAACQSIQDGSYNCTIEQQAPEAGYVELFTIFDNAGFAPGYFIKVISDNEAEVWTTYAGAPWVYLGYWYPAGYNPDCSIPGPQHVQPNDARINLGNNAWELCVYVQ